MATVTKPIALDESFNTTEVTPRNIADVLAEGLSHITGRTASEVEYDNTDSGLTADNVQNAIDELKSDIPTVNDGTLTIQQNGEAKGTFTANQSGNSTVNIETPTTDIQTAVDEFETYNGGLLSECKVTLSPNQDLHGYDHPWVGGAGKNKLPMTVAGIKAANTNGTWNGNVYAINGGTFEVLTDNANNVIGINVNGTFNATTYFDLVGTFDSTYFAGMTFNGIPSTTSATVRISGANRVGLQNIYSGDTTIVDNGSNLKIAIRVATDVTTINELFKPMIRLATETDPTFEPYENKCPISGHTQVDVDVSDGQTTQEQVTVNLGGTYYSGVLDVVSGIFTPDTAEKDLSTLTFRSASQNRWLSEDIKAEVKHPSDSSTKIKFWSDSYYYTDAVTLYFNTSLIGIAVDNEGNLLCRNNDTNPPTGHIVYELATPTSIQLSPTMVKALVGENHLSAPLEGQEITESKYKQMFTFDDVIAYIQSLS